MIIKANHYLKKLLISIIIPTHNSEATIKGCINSLTSQSYPRKKFDKIMCGEFLEHVEDPVKFSSIRYLITFIGTGDDKEMVISGKSGIDS